MPQENHSEHLVWTENANTGAMHTYAGIDSNLSVEPEFYKRGSEYYSFSSLGHSYDQLGSVNAIVDAEVVSSLSRSVSVASPILSSLSLSNTAAQTIDIQEEKQATSTGLDTKNNGEASEKYCTSIDNFKHPDTEEISVIEGQKKVIREPDENTGRDTPASLPGNNHASSSSSGDILDRLGQLSSYPLRPTYKRQERATTPPGLPSFGTEDAQTLRLIPSSQPLWLASVLRRVNSPYPENSRQEAATTTQRGADKVQRSGQLHNNQVLSPIRRALGLAHPVPLHERGQTSYRATLPPGVITAAIPGPLIRADDGSFVRGRFGHRLSGHGIGGRPLDFHPLAQNTVRLSDSERADQGGVKSYSGYSGGIATIQPTTMYVGGELPRLADQRDEDYPRIRSDRNQLTVQSCANQSEEEPNITATPTGISQVLSSVTNRVRNQFSINHAQVASQISFDARNTEDHNSARLTRRGPRRSVSSPRIRQCQRHIMQEPRRYGVETIGQTEASIQQQVREPTVQGLGQQDCEKPTRASCDDC